MDGQHGTNAKHPANTSQGSKKHKCKPQQLTHTTWQLNTSALNKDQVHIIVQGKESY